MEEEIHAFQRKIKTDKSTEISCKFCGKMHDRQKMKCPAFGKRCKKCGKENHFAVTCRSKVSHREQRKKVHAVAEQDSDSCEDIMTVTAVTQEVEAVNHIKDTKMTQKETQQLFAGMMINDNLVNFQIDCGATCNVIPIHMLNPDASIEQTDKVCKDKDAPSWQMQSQSEKSQKQEIVQAGVSSCG